MLVLLDMALKKGGGGWGVLTVLSWNWVRFSYMVNFNFACRAELMMQRRRSRML